jgi:hypothetical protein
VATGDKETEVSCMANLAFALHYRGRRAEGEDWNRKALAGARAIGARAHEAYVRSITGELVEPFGDWGLALEESSAGLAIARALGHREWIVAGLATIGRLRRSCGDVEGARRLHEEMLAIAHDLRTALWIADAESEVGQDLVAAGSPDGAGWLARAVERAGEAAKFSVRARLAQVELALRQDRAGDALEEARRLRRELPQFAVFAAEARRIEAEALAALGRPAEAEPAVRQAKAEATTLGAAPASWRASLALARLLDATGRPAEAQAARADARRLLEKVGVGLTGAPDLLRGFEASPPYREAGAR